MGICIICRDKIPQNHCCMHMNACMKCEGELIDHADMQREKKVLRLAIGTLLRLGLEDAIYNIRSTAQEDESFTGNSWDHPDVKAYADACDILQEYIKSKLGSSDEVT